MLSVLIHFLHFLCVMCLLLACIYWSTCMWIVFLGVIEIAVLRNCWSLYSDLCLLSLSTLHSFVGDDGKRLLVISSSLL